MLITSKADQLKQFNGFNYFDCVVWVRDTGGSATLSKLENPTHDDFSPDWLSDDERSSEDNAWLAYKDFAKTIRQKISELFKLEPSDTLEVDVLTQLGAGWDQVENDQIGRGRQAQILPKEPRRNGATEGRGVAGPAIPPKGEGKRRPKGFRLIPNLHGNQVSTDGWRHSPGSPVCKTKKTNKKLTLRAEFAEPLKNPAGVLFCAINADGELLALTPKILEAEAGARFLEEKIEEPNEEYAVEAFVFTPTVKGSADDQS